MLGYGFENGNKVEVEGAHVRTLGTICAQCERSSADAADKGWGARRDGRVRGAGCGVVIGDGVVGGLRAGS